VKKPAGPRVLVVDDEPSVGMIFHRILGDAGYEVISAANGAEGLRALKKQEPDLVFLDLQMPGMDGIETLRRLRETHPDLTVIIMTAYQTVHSAVETMKLGALDYLIKPLDAERLKSVVHQALELGEVTRRTPAVKGAGRPETLPTEEIVARGPEMSRVMSLIEKVSPTDIPVLILGESGTGKEVAARQIHRLSRRAAKPFVVVDCAALPESLIESELFGHEKGAFTGADAARAGKFEQADGGTVFLDEIGNLPLAVQVKLLRFLQNPSVERLGSRRGPVALNVRVVAATNVDLETAVKNGTFREDLFHRLKVFVVDMPPLRSRGTADLEGLLSVLLENFRRQLGKAKLTVAPESLQLFRAYPWPGNIRELQNALRSASLLADDVLRPDHLPVSVQNARPRPYSSGESGALNDVIRRVERDHIAKTLEHCRGDRAAAARALGLDAATLEDKLKDFGLS
jgi:DNA-binding NtrC family response regulator